MQSAITPILAILHVNLILTAAKVSSPDNAFIFPHALFLAQPVIAADLRIKYVVFTKCDVVGYQIEVYSALPTTRTRHA